MKTMIYLAIVAAVFLIAVTIGLHAWLLLGVQIVCLTVLAVLAVARS